MSVDFFDTQYKESPRKDKKFGVCDDEDSTKAYTDIDSKSKWIATVENENSKKITFTPIDNCIIIYQEKSTTAKESTCDGMLTFEKSLYLVELKDKGAEWKVKSEDQLRNTIRLLQINNPEALDKFTYKKAFGCNKRHPRFKTIEHEESKRFFNETNGFRLDFQATIKIK